MKLYHIYLKDFLIRSIYVIISFSFCWTILFKNIDILFLFEAYPLLCIVPKKRFILTQLTQLFSTVWFLCTFFSFISVLPLIWYYIKIFLSSGWYKYQLKLYSILLIGCNFTFNFFYFWVHFYVVPNLISFFLYWEILNEYSLLRIEIEVSLLFYINLIIKFKLVLCFLLTIYFLLFFIMFYFNRIEVLYFIILTLKKLCIFITTFVLCIIIPFNLIEHLYSLLLVFFLIETYFFLVCTKLYKINIIFIKCLQLNSY